MRTNIVVARKKEAIVVLTSTGLSTALALSISPVSCSAFTCVILSTAFVFAVALGVTLIDATSIIVPCFTSRALLAAPVVDTFVSGIAGDAFIDSALFLAYLITLAVTVVLALVVD